MYETLLDLGSRSMCAEQAYSDLMNIADNHCKISHYIQCEPKDTCIRALDISNKPYHAAQVEFVSYRVRYGQNANTLTFALSERSHRATRCMSRSHGPLVSER